MFKWLRKFEQWVLRQSEPRQPQETVLVDTSEFPQVPYLEKPKDVAIHKPKTASEKFKRSITRSGRISKMIDEMTMDGLSENEIQNLIDTYGQEGSWNAWQNTKRAYIPENEKEYIPGTVGDIILRYISHMTVEKADIQGV